MFSHIGFKVFWGTIVSETVRCVRRICFFLNLRTLGRFSQITHWCFSRLVLVTNFCGLPIFFSRHRSEAYGVADRAVGKTQEGTAATWVRCGLVDELRSEAMKCCCYLMNIHDSLADGKIAHGTRFCALFWMAQRSLLEQVLLQTLSTTKMRLEYINVD